MFATEKQINFIKSLYSTIQEIAPTLSAQDATEVATILKPHAQIIANAIGDEDVSSFDAKKLIPVLVSIKENYRPASEDIRWKKIGNDWCIYGPASKIEVGAEVQVISKNKTQTVKVGEIVSVDGDTVYAMPYREDTSHVTPGFYHKDDQIIEAYKTKKGFLVARSVDSDGTKEYLGKQGLIGLGEKLTLEEAKAFGRETGICMVCGAQLTDPHSIAEGIGPTCASKWGF